MGKTYVTMVSEQAAPNVQYIKEFAHEVSTYLFISTRRMDKDNKVQSIIDACLLDESKYQVDTVDEECLSDILNSLTKAVIHEKFSETDGYIVNCTLGTKIMSIALYEFFKDKQNALLLYSPINTNRYRSVLDNSINKTFTARITVPEYVRSYGIQIQGTGSPHFDSSAYCDKLFSKFIEFTDVHFSILMHLQNDRNQEYRKKGLADVTVIEGLTEFLAYLEFPRVQEAALSKAEVKYLTGGWFEEWTYYQIKERLQLETEEIVLGLNTRINAANDLDVVFMYKNNIHIIECKTLMDDKYLQESTIYKSGALIDKFGRNAYSYLFTLSNLRTGAGELKQGIKDRAAQQKITIADKIVLTENFNFFIRQHFS